MVGRDVAGRGPGLERNQHFLGSDEKSNDTDKDHVVVAAAAEARAHGCVFHFAVWAGLAHRAVALSFSLFP